MPNSGTTDYGRALELASKILNFFPRNFSTEQMKWLLRNPEIIREIFNEVMVRVSQTGHSSTFIIEKIKEIAPSINDRYFHFNEKSLPWQFEVRNIGIAQPESIIWSDKPGAYTDGVSSDDCLHKMWKILSEARYVIVQRSDDAGMLHQAWVYWDKSQLAWVDYRPTVEQSAFETARWIHPHDLIKPWGLVRSFRVAHKRA